MFGFLRRRPADQPPRQALPPPAPQPPTPSPRTPGIQIAPPPDDDRWPTANLIQDMFYNGASPEAVIWVLRALDTAQLSAVPAADTVTTSADASADALRRRRERDAKRKRDKRKSRKLQLVGNGRDVTRGARRDVASAEAA